MIDTHTTIRNKLDLIVQLQSLPETEALWHQDEVIRLVRHGEAKFVRHSDREAPVTNSMRRVFRAIQKLFTLDKTGTQFTRRPADVDEDGFRPYFVSELMEDSSITSERTLSESLSYWERAGVIERRKSRNAVTGEWEYAKMRFHPDVLLRWAKWVILLLKQVKFRVKEIIKRRGFSRKSPSAVERGYSSVSNPGVAAPVAAVAAVVVEEGDSVPAGNSIPFSSPKGTLKTTDKKLEEVLTILKSEYPDASDPDYQLRKQIRELVHCIFARHRLTPEIARQLVKAKIYDDQNVGAHAANTLGLLKGFNRFDKFSDLLPFWKRHLTRLLRTLCLNGFDDQVGIQEARLKTLGYAIFDETPAAFEQPLSSPDKNAFRQLARAVRHNLATATKLAQNARDYLLNDSAAYAILVRKLPQVQKLCGIKHGDHHRLVQAHRDLRIRISAWENMRNYLKFE